MRKIIKKLLGNISLNPFKFFLVMMFISYGFGFFISLIYLNDEYIAYSLSTMAIILSGVFLFGSGWSIAKKITIQPLSYNACVKTSYIFTAIFLLSAYYIFSETPPAVFANILGTDMSASQLRAAATKGKSGIDSIINGLFYASSYIGISFLALIFFFEERKFKWFVFFIVVFLLVLNGQKSRFLIPLLPIMILFIQNYKFKHVSRLIFIGAGTLFLLMLSLNFLEIGSNSGHHVIIDAQERLTQGGRDLFAHQTPLKFIIHRLIWVPYITAIDWFRYIDTVLTENLMGASIPIFSDIFGLERINLDNAVFKFQFNVSLNSLGAANTFFAFDTIANFGYIGLLILSPIFGIIFGLIWKGLPRPFNLMIFLWLYSFQSSSFQAIFLGGGMFIILFLVLAKNITKPRIRIR